MKIVFLDAKTLGDDVSLDVFKTLGEFITYDITSKEQVIDRVKEADIILTNKVVIDKEVMDEAKNLKLICVTATGVNNIDLDYAKKKGVIVKNAAGYSTASVTQHTFALALALNSQIIYYDEFVKSKKYAKSEIFTNLERPFWEIKGKKWGIIGLGTIGRSIASVASAFGAKVCYFSTSGVFRDEPYERVELEEMLKSCDIISIHAPLNEKTKGLIGPNELALMKKGAILLNLGRGGIVDEEALARALDERGILAGLDVLESEPMSKESPLLAVKNSDNLIITPHIAWASYEARCELIKIVAKNIEDFLKSV